MYNPAISMADPLRDQDTSSRIEELLLAGLDHYFNGQHELAISVWTRVLFLDRSHARARAYIERARSAIAERQREGEELLQTGIAAFQRGDTAHARELLTSAVERAARPEEALAVLERLDRLAPSTVSVDASAPSDTPSRRPRLMRSMLSPKRTGASAATIVGVLAIGLAAGALVMIAWTSGLLPWAPPAQPAADATARPVVDPLPVPSASEVSLARANGWYKNGRLHDALAALDAIGPGDPLRARADELRSAIQQKLLETARATEPPAPRQP
jgi:tetratricopeptide (TPR) repeat protein